MILGLAQEEVLQLVDLVLEQRSAMALVQEC
jgi:hypothetical protein